MKEVVARRHHVDATCRHLRAAFAQHGLVITQLWAQVSARSMTVRTDTVSADRKVAQEHKARADNVTQTAETNAAAGRYHVAQGDMRAMKGYAHADRKRLVEVAG